MSVNRYGSLLASLALAACAPASSAPARPVLIPTEPQREPEPVYAVPSGRELTGELDPTFGSSGTALFEKAPGEQRFSAITALPDGSFVTAGYAPFGDGHDMVAARVRGNGSLDETFGERGFARIGERRGFAHVVAHDDQGRILVGGYFYGKNGNDMLLARLDGRGRLDPSFGSAGFVVHDAGKNDQPHALFVHPDGRITVVGYLSESQNAVVRFTSSGTLDSDFGVGGVAAFGNQKTGFATAGALAPDGGVIAGGYLAQQKRGFVARVDAMGRPDPAFGRDGVVTLDDPAMSSAWAVGVDRRGRVLLGGTTKSGAAVVRFTGDGSLDRSFGENGIAWADRAADDQFYAFSFDSADNILGVGFRGVAEDASLLVVRFKPSGALDEKFGARGRVIHELDGGAFSFAATWDPKGGLVVAGDVWKGSRSRALVARFR